jgi:hypothetical protein
MTVDAGLVVEAVGEAQRTLEPCVGADWDVPAGAPTAVLLWCTGRSALPDRPRQIEWGWDATVR